MAWYKLYCFKMYENLPFYKYDDVKPNLDYQYISIYLSVIMKSWHKALTKNVL